MRPTRLAALALTFGLLAAFTACQREAPPTPEGAVAVITSHYKAINDKRYQDAYSQWESNGKASGKTLIAFLNSSAQMEKVDVTTGTPSRIEGAAGSRYITVPVEVTAHRQNGTEERYTGTYTLRYSVVEGAKPKQRRWQIYKFERADQADSLGGGPVS